LVNLIPLKQGIKFNPCIHTASRRYSVEARYEMLSVPR
jgi:hypothetical protein